MHPWEIARFILPIVLIGGLSLAFLPGQVRKISSDLDYAGFAASVASRLAEIETGFRAGRERLRVEAVNRGGPYLSEEVEALLGTTEEQVLATLEPQELAPLRDSIRLRFHRIRQKLAFVEPTRPSGIAFASFQPAQASPDLHLLSPHVAEALFDEVHAVLQRLFTLATENRFSLRLCVVSRPDAGATFRMRPPEYSEGVKSGKTAYDFREIALGRYFYKVEPRKKTVQPIVCGWDGGGEDDPCLDLWDSSGDQLFDCDFGEGSCELRDLPPGGCSVR